MKFTKMVAITAILGLAAVQASAQSNGTLRRTLVAQNDSQAEVEGVSPAQNQGVVILNTNTNSNSNDMAQASSNQMAQQPATIVEATPLGTSNAENLRRSRQNAEIQTEQKIVEKLEESRLREEQQRAERLFGNKFDAPQAPAAPVVAPAPVAPAPVAPVEEKPTQVTIQKVEIIQPAIEKKEEEVAEPVAESKTKVDQEMVTEVQASQRRYYLGASLGSPGYSATNVKSNYAMGFSLGTIIDNRWGVEGSFLYSNHFVDTFWQTNLYRELDQYEIGANVKYYVFDSRLKPYVGGNATYIYRLYQDRIKTGPAWQSYNSYTTEEETHAVNLGVGLGLDFEVNQTFMIGAGVDWSTNIMNRNDFDFLSYGLPENSKALEEIGFYTVKLNAKLVF